MKLKWIFLLFFLFLVSCASHQEANTVNLSSDLNSPAQEIKAASSETEKWPPSRQEKLLQESIKLLDTMLHSPNKTVNEEVLANAKAIVFFPLVIEQEFTSKAAFGNGVVSIRSPETGKWGPPIFHKLMGVNFGQWAGLQAWDLIFLVVSEKGKNTMFHPGYQFGQELTMAYGAIDIHSKIRLAPYLSKRDIFVYSRAQGAFVGLSTGGGMINNNPGANTEFYGAPHSPKEILTNEGQFPLPPAAIKFMEELNKLAPRNQNQNIT